MDGTLVDSAKDITISVNFVRQKNHNLPPLSEDYIVKAINKKDRNLAKLFYNTEIYEERDRELFEAHYHEQCIQNPILYDGILELLEDLKTDGVMMAVATNAPTLFAKRILGSLGVDGYFFKIIGADRAKPKPDPAMIEMILNGLEYSKAWMVGDNPKDIEVAKNANIGAIYAKWGFCSEVEHDIVTNHPMDVLESIGVR